MIIKRNDKFAKRIVDCHHGKGVLWCAEMLADYKKTASGFKYIHDNSLEPGASIGEHQHEKDEEIYAIISGRGVMKIDGVEQAVGPGDVCLTRSGHSHDLTNGLEGPMHFLVICTNT
jgi:mannose-6-phosphate isomerase-like protein (cupin superfamily)